MFGFRKLEESYREFMQERLDFQAEQIKSLKDELSEWRRLFQKQTDMVQGELGALNGWVATICSAQNLPLPENIDLDPEKVFVDETPLDESTYDPANDMNLDALLGTFDKPDEEDVGEPEEIERS